MTSKLRQLSGCREIKAITTLPNTQAIEFHRSLGMKPSGESAQGGIEFVRDYSGPGLDRVVLKKPI